MSKIKEKILAVGIDLFSNKGYNNVGLNEILLKSEVPKGSFYYYFKSKEDFGIQVINRYSSQGIKHFKQYLESNTLSPKNRIIQFYKERADNYLLKGCLMGNASAELSDLSVNFSSVLSKELSNWQNVLEKCIEAAKLNGEIASDSRPKMLASFILNSWEGALLRMKCEKTINPLKDFIEGLTLILK